MKIIAPAAFAATAALALAASAQPPQGPAPPKPRPSCFWTSRVENFAAVDPESVYLRVGNRDVYQARLFATCLDLEWVHNLALVTRSSSLVCEGPNPDATVIVRATGVGRQRCPVTSLTKLTPEQVAALPPGARP
jgi:hypothetical protein